MSSITIQPVGFSAAIRERIRQDTQMLRRVALDVALEGVNVASKLTRDKGVGDQGFYLASWGAQAIPEGAVLENTAPYAGIIEHGRRPNRPGPPLAPILGWVMRKLVRSGEVTEAEAPGVAFLIRRSIHEHGTAPRNILRLTVGRIRPRFQRAAVAALRARSRGPLVARPPR